MTQWNVQFRENLSFNDFDQAPRKGRNPFEGYIRGCGLSFGNMEELCNADPDYKNASALAAGRSICAVKNLMNIFIIFKFYLSRIERGAILEFGSFRGGSAIFMAYLAQRYLGGVPVVAFDTFAGMPPTDRAVDAHRNGDFNNVNLQELRAFVARVNLTNLTFVQGLFQETAPKVLAQIGPVSLVHIDCDIQSAVAYAYDAVKPSMVKGGYILLDDAIASTCIGATEAMEELMVRRDGLHAEQTFPHVVFRYSPI